MSNVNDWCENENGMLFTLLIISYSILKLLLMYTK